MNALERCIVMFIIYAASLVGIFFMTKYGGGDWNITTVMQRFFVLIILQQLFSVLAAVSFFVVSLKKQSRGSFIVRYSWQWKFAGWISSSEPENSCQLFVAYWEKFFLTLPLVAMSLTLYIFYSAGEIIASAMRGRFPAEWKWLGKENLFVDVYQPAWKYISPWKVLLPLGVVLVAYAWHAFFAAQWHEFVEALASFTIPDRWAAVIVGLIIAAAIIMTFRSQEKKIAALIGWIKKYTCLSLVPPVK